MKTNLLFLIFLFQLYGFSVQSQNDTILLNPEFGKEYIYEFTESQYILTEQEERFNSFDRIKTLKIKYDKIQPENKEILMVSMEKNVAIRPDYNPIQIKDYKYPDFKDGYYEQRFTDFYESLFCRVNFKYEFDFKTSKIKLINRDEILMKVHSILKEKGFDESGIRKEIRRTNEDGIALFSNLIQSIYRVPTGSFDEKMATEYESKISVLPPNSIFTQKRYDVKPGLYSRNIVSNQQQKYLVNSNTIQIDSARYRIRSADNKYYSLVHHEKDISLKSIKTVGNKQIKIAGNIENQRNKKVIISWLKKPFGTTFQQETLFLDENNSFYFETELEHAQPIYLQFGYNNFVENLPMILIYAEPGGEIHFEATSETFPWEIKFSGDFQNANEMIYNFRKKHPIFVEKFNLNYLQWYSSNLNNLDFETALTDFENYFESYKNKVESNAYQFIKHEIKAQLMHGAIDYLYRKVISETRIFSYYFPQLDSINWNLLENELSKFNINKNYNSYGIHSRIFAKDFLSYNFSVARKTGDIGFPEYSTTLVTRGYKYTNDLPLQAEFAKTILSGPALYGEIADNLFQQKMRASNGESQTEMYVQNKADEYFDLMLRVCNDEELNKEVKEIVATHLEWKNEEYVPEMKFFNPKGEEVYMKDFFGKKPTIFYVSRDWASERYYFDDLSIENPEINYVLIVEGSNFKEWTDYIKAAEPKANQLFLFNTEKHLPDIFKVSYQNFIIYDENGKRLSYGSNPLQVTNLVKQYLQDPKKKELNKSQLIFIIAVLGIVLAAFIIGLLFWKWRVRQRFRKEAQIRKLRELELTAIRSQMNPHFLFNSLNSVQNLFQQNKGR
ncbi:MAG: histidine kinase, partial [Prolixibacteraceae bacterium]|nr:histidine kinase [Prolixibacteraceae bacterium]